MAENNAVAAAATHGPRYATEARRWQAGPRQEIVAWGDQAKMRSSCKMTDRKACLLQTGLVGGYEISEELD